MRARVRALTHTDKHMHTPINAHAHTHAHAHAKNEVVLFVTSFGFPCCFADYLMEPNHDGNMSLADPLLETKNPDNSPLAKTNQRFV